MTGICWAGAVAALLAAWHACARLRRDHARITASPAACMLAAGASMVLAALTPERAWLPQPAGAWASPALGLLATWTFPGMLSAVAGGTGRPAVLPAIPVPAWYRRASPGWRCGMRFRPCPAGERHQGFPSPPPGS